MPLPDIVHVDQKTRDLAVSAVLAYNDLQKAGATDENPDPGPSNRVDNFIVADERAQQFGQSFTPLFLPLDKLDPNLSEANRQEFGLTDRQAIYKQLGDNGLLPQFVAMIGLFVDKLITDKWTTTIRTKYNVAVTDGSTIITITDPGNLPHSNASNVTGVPVNLAYEANYVEIMDRTTGGPLLVQAGVHAGERVYGRTRVGGSTSPNSVEIELVSRPLGTSPEETGTVTPYTWETGLAGNAVNLFYGFRQSLDQLDDTAFRRVFR